MSTETPAPGTTPISALTPSKHIPELFAAHVLRITCRGKIRHWVKNTLMFLEEQRGLPVVLHKLPGGYVSIEAGGSGEDRRDEEKGEEAERVEDDGEAGDDDSELQTKKQKHAHGSSNNDENPSKKARLELTSLSAPSTTEHTSSTASTKSPSTDPSKPSKQTPWTNNIPRLLSTTEIIKRASPRSNCLFGLSLGCTSITSLVSGGP